MANIELLKGDCLQLMKGIPDKSVNMILCDLPYGITACEWDSVIPLEELWEEYERIITDVGAIVLFGQEPFSSLVRASNLPLYRYDWIWKKQKPSNFQLMNYQCGRVHENIMVFSKGKACYTKTTPTMNYFPIMESRDRNRISNAKVYNNGKTDLLHNYQKANEDNFKNYTHKHPTSILSFNTVEHRVHPTQKPVDLLEYLIRTYTVEGETVLDNCMGSGSTGVAARNLDRNFIGIEITDEYFDIAKNRIENSDSEVMSKKSDKHSDKRKPLF